MAVYQVTGSPQLWLDILLPVSNSTRVGFDTKHPCILDHLVQIPTPVLLFSPSAGQAAATAWDSGIVGLPLCPKFVNLLNLS